LIFLNDCAYEMGSFEQVGVCRCTFCYGHMMHNPISII
jgi:hypothetical protein